MKKDTKCSSVTKDVVLTLVAAAVLLAAAALGLSIEDLAAVASAIVCKDQM